MNGAGVRGKQIHVLRRQQMRECAGGSVGELARGGQPVVGEWMLSG